LLSFAVADYKDYNFYTRLNDKDSVLVQNFIFNRPDYLENNKGFIDKTGDYLKYYSGKFGIYPFLKEKYGHCLAPIGGGMEHQTMTTLSSFENSLVSHELAHQWFGDLVTCASWQDIWVNEGFASYCEFLVLDNPQLHESAENWIVSAHQSALREPSGSVYIPIQDCQNDFRIFNYNLTYKKGASIIHMLRYELNNDSLFFVILRRYLHDFKDSVATGADFMNIVNRLSGQNYNWFLDQWYYGQGFPIFELKWKYEKGNLTLVSKQSTSDKSVPFFRTHFNVKLNFAKGDTVIRLLQDKPLNTYNLPVMMEVTGLTFDPDEWLLKKVKIENVSELPK
jgi:aminopeptidase N